MVTQDEFGARTLGDMVCCGRHSGLDVRMQPVTDWFTTRIGAHDSELSHDSKPFALALLTHLTALLGQLGAASPSLISPSRS